MIDFYGFSIVDILIVMVGFSMVPLLVDVLNTFIPVGRLVHAYLSRCLIVMLVVLYSSALFFFFFMVIPFYRTTWLEEAGADSVASIAILLANCFFAVWLWANTVYCYYNAIMCSPSLRALPGTKGTENAGEGETNLPAGLRKRKPNSSTNGNSMEESDNAEAKGAETAAGTVKAKVRHNTERADGLRYCRPCDIWRSSVTHHCRQCGRCIENMDHHCPFTANCVSTGSRGNFVFFFLFILYTTMGCAYVCLTTSLPFWHCFLQREESLRCSHVGPMALIFVPGVIAFLGVGTLTLAHGFMIVMGKSTLQVLRWLYGQSSELDEEDIESLRKMRGTFIQLLFPYLLSY